MKYIIACQVDSNCVVVAEHSEDLVEERSLEKGGKLWGLKIGIACAFLAITVIATFVPALFKGFSSYQVCSPRRIVISICPSWPEFGFGDSLHRGEDV